MTEARRWKIAATALVGAMTLAACGGGGDGKSETAGSSKSDDAPAAATCEATVTGTQITFGQGAANSAFDPPATSGAYLGGSENAAVWDLLFYYDTQTQQLVPQLAEGLTPNDDFTEWTLKLRSGITYSDGAAFNAQLVKDNLDRWQTAKGVRNVHKGLLDYIDSMDVVDELTLKFTLSVSFADFGLVLADEPGMIVNLAAIGDDLDAFRVQPSDAAGLGPYVVERNVPGEEIVMRARADYWGGPVCVERLRFVLVPGASATYDAYRSGQLDVAFLRDPVMLERAKKEADNSFFILVDGGEQYYLNHREGHGTADVRVRKAINLAVDPEVLSNRAFQGTLLTGTSLINPSSRWFNDKIEAFKPDMDEAKRLVAEAKADGWDGKITIVNSNAGNRADLGLALKSMLEAAGMTVQLDLVESNEIVSRMAASEFDLAASTINASEEMVTIALFRQFRSDALTNRSGYKNSDLDELLSEALATPLDKAQDVVTRINNHFTDDAINLSFGAGEEGFVWRDGLDGVKTSTSSIMLFHAAALR